MFHIFGKKKFLVDYLENFVDIHNHILPGIDDGAKTVEDSIALIKGFSRIGVTNFIATPHIMHNYYPNNPKTINNAFSSLQDKMLENNLKHISVEASAEHMIDDNFESILKSGEIMPMRHDYLLVEMSYLQPPINFDEAIITTVSNRLYPILAHPERYKFLQHRKHKYRKYKEQGILFQMNLLSLGDFYGAEVPKTAFKLLEEGLIDFVASDVHNLNQLNYLKETTISNKTLKLLLPIIDNTIKTFY